MKVHYTVLVIFLILLASVFSAVSQERPKKWVIDPVLSSSFHDPKNNTIPAELPQVNTSYVHPNTQPRVLSTSQGMFIVSPSQRVLPTNNVHQSEVIIVRHPTNANILFGSSNAIAFVGSSFTTISEGVYVSTNGGVNWFGTDTLQGAPINNHGGDPGPAIDKDGNFVMTHLGFTQSGMFGNGSADNGTTWSENFPIQLGSMDKNLACTDDVPSSPFYGRSYVVYVQFSSGFPARISFTSNGGVNWSPPVTPIAPVSGFIVRGSDIAVGPGGVVYSIWGNGSTGNGVEDFMSFVKSTDGGVTWTGANNVQDMNGLLVFGTGFQPYGIRMNSFPRIVVDKTGGPRNGWIYVAASQRNLAPAGSDADIVLFRSSNGGTNWMPPVRVNQDPLNNGKLQFFNAVAVDDSGGVNIIYYSNTNTASDSAEVIVARSTDGGSTFTEIILSDHRFRPKSINLGGIASGYSGDYIGITAKGDKIHGIWMDDITGVYQAWHASIQLTSPPPPGGFFDTTICRNGLNKPITDFNVTYDTISINPGATCAALDVNVTLDSITHSFASDLVIRLTKGSQSVLLVNQRGGSGANFRSTILNDSAANPISAGSAPFTGQFRPETPLAAFNSQTLNGSWILSIRDTASGDTGILRSWCISFVYDCQVGISGTTNEIPQGFQLKQNYPNPFNPVTKIGFSLPKSSEVKIIIYDVMGQEVKTIVNEFRNAGNYEVGFDASNFASGVYYYRMSAGEFTEVKKMVLLK
jgi:subtilisin-like proprotein convertase family protein